MADLFGVTCASPAVPAAPAGGQTTPASEAEHVKSLAAQFESLLLSQMLRQMRSSMFSDGEDKSSGTEPLADTMYSELGLALSRAGGFGLADVLSGALMRQIGTTGARTEPPAPSDVATGPDAAAEAPAAAVAIPAMPAPGGAPLPAHDTISSAFGWRRDPIDGQVKFHNGVDLPMASGTDVRAVNDGVVSQVDTISGYGLTVVIDHGGGLQTRYAHLSSAAVRVGDAVTSGQVIAASGNSGRSTGPHLHFEVLENGQPVDPQSQATRR